MTPGTVRVYATRGDAEVAAARLRAAGIATHIAADDEGGLNPGFYRTYGVRLVVDDSLVGTSRQLLGFGDLRIHEQAVAAMAQHARFCAPDEACGLLAVDRNGEVRMVYCCTNVDASPHRYTVDPTEHFHALRHADAMGWEIGGVFHSHPGGDARPSATDVARALDPTWWYVIVGRDGLRAFRIDDAVEEVAITVHR